MVIVGGGGDAGAGIPRHPCRSDRDAAVGVKLRKM